MSDETATHSADYACSTDQEQERNMCALPMDDMGRCDDNEVEFRSRVIDPSSTAAGGVGPWSPWSRYVTQFGSGLTGAADAAVAAAVRDTVQPELVAVTTLTNRIYTSEGALFRTIESEFRTIGDGRKLGAAMTAPDDRRAEQSAASAKAVVAELDAVWEHLRGCAHAYDPECARCEWLAPLTEALASHNAPPSTPAEAGHMDGNRADG